MPCGDLMRYGDRTLCGVPMLSGEATRYGEVMLSGAAMPCGEATPCGAAMPQPGNNKNQFTEVRAAIYSRPFLSCRIPQRTRRNSPRTLRFRAFDGRVRRENTLSS